MAAVDPWADGAVEFVETAANRRATTYRDRASQLVEMAASQPIGSIRDQLRALAARYEGLAARLELSRPARWSRPNPFRAETAQRKTRG